MEQGQSKLSDSRLKRIEIVEQYRASAARDFLVRIRTFELSVLTLRRNHDDFERVINSHRPEPRDVFERMRSREWVEDYLVELTRTLHNFVAAAFTLVDNTRVFYRELYEPKNLMPGYQQEIDGRFIKDGLSNFIKDLRQFCQHKQLPLAGLQVGVHAGNTGLSLIWRVRVAQGELMKFAGWSTASKNFIQASGDVVDLQDVTRAYREKVEAFHKWFEEQQREIHKAEYDYLEEVKGKLHDLDAEAATAEGAHDPERDELLADEKPLTDEEIRPVAFQIYLEDGCRGGREKEHWDAAVRRIKERRSLVR